MATDELKVYISLDGAVEASLEQLMDRLQKNLESRAAKMGIKPGQVVSSKLKTLLPLDWAEYNEQTGQVEMRKWRSAAEKKAGYEQVMRDTSAKFNAEANALTDRLMAGDLTKEKHDELLKALNTRLGTEREKLQGKIENASADPLSSAQLNLKYQVPETDEQRNQRERQEEVMRRTLEARRKALINKQNEAAGRAEKAGMEFEKIPEEAVIEYEKLINANIQALNNQIKLAKMRATGDERMKEALESYSQATAGKPYSGTDIATDYRNMQRDKKANAEKKRKADAEFDKYLVETYKIPALEKDIKSNAAFLGQPVPHMRATTQEQRIKEMQVIHAAQREQMSDKFARDKYEQDKMKHMIMSSASLGIGLFGNAAMPMLNVAFSAWSGGAQMAGIAAVATIIGESYRGIERLRDAAKQAADSLSYVSRSSLKLQSRDQAINAFYGGMVQDQLDLSMGRTSKFKLQNMRDFLEFEASWGGMKSGFSHASDNYLQKVMKDFNNDWLAAIPNTAINALGDLGNFIADWISTGKKDSAKLSANFIHNNELRIRELELVKLGGSAGVENDPYQIWQRVQNSLLDPMKAREQELLQEQINQLKELNARLKFIEEDKKKPSMFNSPPEIDREGKRRSYNPFTDWEFWIF